MARQLGGDAPLMAGITAFQTVAAALAMPVVLSALASAFSLTTQRRPHSPESRLPAGHRAIPHRRPRAVAHAWPPALTEKPFT